MVLTPRTETGVINGCWGAMTGRRGTARRENEDREREERREDKRRARGKAVEAMVGNG